MTGSKKIGTCGTLLCVHNSGKHRGCLLEVDVWDSLGLDTQDMEGTQLDLSCFGLLSPMPSSMVIFMLGCPIRCYHGANRERLETRAWLCRAFPSDWANGNKNIGVVMRNSAIFFSFYVFYVFSRLCHRKGIILFIYYFGYWNRIIISFLLYLS
jgi:hypothetical protein